MLTREQIEKCRSSLKKAYFVSVDALCDLALRGLEAQWRPIEEAPKDKMILAYKGTWKRKYVVAYHERNHWRVAAIGTVITPTNFMLLPGAPNMPLPQPPEVKP